MAGNAVDEITVHAGTGRELDEDARWADFGVPYYIKRFNSTTWTIRAGLTLEPGVVLQMDPGMVLSFERGGGLSAIGTPDAEIVFERHGAGKWGALTFIDADGELDHATISDGGGTGREANIVIRTIDVAAPPSATVGLTPNVTMSGATYNISFDLGDTYATGCIDPVFVPASDTVADHCI